MAHKNKATEKSGTHEYGNGMKRMNQSDVRNLPDGDHHFGDGLYLRVRGNSRTWVLRIQVKGKRTFRGIGSAYELTLTQAKTQAMRLKLSMKDGDTRTKSQKAKDAAAPVAAEGMAFEDVWLQAVEARERVASWKGEKQGLQWRQSLRDYAVPVLGKLDVSSITRNDILRVLQPLWLTKTDTATKLRSRLEILFDFFIREGLREKENPARWKGGLEFDLPSAFKNRVRHHHEAPALADLCKAVPRLLETGTGRCALFGILTACRLSEFLKARWSEIDFASQTFSVPPERRKDGKQIPHRVPLSSQAINLLKSLDSKGEFVFAGKAAATYCLDAPRKALRDATLKPITMHGCRSTFRDWCAETGVDPVVAEKCLMHVTGNEVE